MGSLSKLMQKLDELELNQNVPQDSADAAEKPAAAEQAEASEQLEAAEATEATESQSTPPVEATALEATAEVADETLNAAESPAGDDLIVDEFTADEFTAEEIAAVEDIAEDGFAETDADDVTQSVSKAAAWQPVTNDSDTASESEPTDSDTDTLIDVSDVEALLAEHGPDGETEPVDELATSPATDEAQLDQAVQDESAAEADAEIDLFAEEPDDADELARQSVNELLDDVSPEQTEKQHSNLFTTSSANEADAAPATTETLPAEATSSNAPTAESQPVAPATPASTTPASTAPAPAAPRTGDDQTVPWDAAKVDPAVIAFHNRYAAMCEQYRSLRARLLSMNPSGAHQIITVTSSVPEEGKSVTTMNLAICLAEGSQQRVLVVDADFRRASVARMVNAKHSPGMAELILSQQRLEDVIQHTPYPNLKLISAGMLGAASYGELLASPRIPAVFEELRERFSYVLVDTPPVTTVSDVSMLAPLSDGALMVVEMGRTPEPTVQLAVRTLQTNNVNVLGCVLSRYRDQRKHYYDRYYDYYDRH